MRGEAGPAGPAGGVLGFADFYALIPPDNACAVTPGFAVDFPNDAAVSAGITRATASSFILAEIGTYLVQFEVGVDHAGQLVVTLNGAELAYTVSGHAAGSSAISGIAIVTTTTADSVIAVANPAGNPTALKITPCAGGTLSDSAHLVIVRLK